MLTNAKIVLSKAYWGQSYFNEREQLRKKNWTNVKEILSIDVVLQLFAWVSLSSLNAIYFQSNFTFWWQSFYYFLLCFLATKTWRKNRTKYIGRLKLPVELQVYGKISSANIPLSTLLPSWLGVRVHFLFSEKYHLQTSVSALYYLADWHPHP